MVSLKYFALSVLFLGLNSLICLNVAAAEPKITQGADYWAVPKLKLDDANNLDDLQQIADIEVFYWYGCASCQKVEQALASFLADNPGLTLRRTPLVAHLNWRPQAYLQPLIEQLEGKVQTPSDEALYAQCIEDCRVFNSYESIKSWLESTYSISNWPTIDEVQIWRAEKKYRQRAESFSISQVPTIIIRESYVTDAKTAKTTERLLQIIEHIISLN